jgi:hypothetical protein
MNFKCGVDAPKDWRAEWRKDSKSVAERIAKAFEKVGMPEKALKAASDKVDSLRAVEDKLLERMENEDEMIAAFNMAQAIDEGIADFAEDMSRRNLVVPQPQSRRWDITADTLVAIAEVIREEARKLKMLGE